MCDPQLPPFFSSSIMSGLPAAATRVGNQSRPDTIEFGPTQDHLYSEATFERGALASRKRRLAPSGQVKFSAPLSVVKPTMVLLSRPLSFKYFMTEPTISSSWAMPASSSDQLLSELRKHPHKMADLGSGALTQAGSPDPRNDRICITSSCPRQSCRFRCRSASCRLAQAPIRKTFLPRSFIVRE